MNQKLQDFCRRYELTQDNLVAKLSDLYDIDELSFFLPTQPTAYEKEVLQRLIGTTNNSGYLDYIQSTNTFELIMLWKEQTHNL